MLILFGLTVVYLIAFIGLAVDLGRFFVIKTELQNAMDACALSAASQLRPGSNNAADLMRAVAYGRVFTTGGTAGNDAIRNKANFQSTTVNLANSDVKFATSINGNYATSDTVNANARFAKCEYPLSGLPIYFMPVLNPNLTSQTVSAMAVATGGAQICNVIPVGICPRAGIRVGDWLDLGVDTGTNDPAKGWFRWVQFDGIPGANAVRDSLLNAGTCNIPTSLVVKQAGNINSANEAWNTRFGIYQGLGSGINVTTAPPDKTGYSFFNHSQLQPANRNWDVPDINPGTGARALPTFNTGETSPNFWNYSDSFTVVSGHTATDPGLFNPNPPPTSGGILGEHNTLGLINRRLVIIPIMSNCTNGATATNSFACALMLNPFGQVTGGGPAIPINGKLEYLGPIGAGSPCGNGTVLAPKLSVLVK